MSGKPDQQAAWRLYADLGNSTLHWGACQGARWCTQGREPTDALDERATAGRIVEQAAAAGLAREDCSGAALVTSQPGLAALGEAILARVCAEPPLVLGRDVSSGLHVSYHDPAQMGQDRLAAVEGALAQLAPPLVVLGFGTCVTAEAVSAEGTVVGGAIAPGLEAHLAGLRATVPHLAEAIEQAAAALREGRQTPATGRSTAESLWLGLLVTLVGAAERMVAFMRQQVGEQAKVVATGGDAALVAAHTTVIDRVEPMLVLDGLRAIAEGHSPER